MTEDVTIYSLHNTQLTIPEIGTGRKGIFCFAAWTARVRVLLWTNPR